MAPYYTTYTPVKSQFYYIQVGFDGGQNYIGAFSWCGMHIQRRPRRDCVSLQPGQALRYSLLATSIDPDQTSQILRLIWVYTGCICEALSIF